MIVAPTFNHCSALRRVLDQLDVVRAPIIVVNDGATDRTEQVLDEWTSGSGNGPDRMVIKHDVNRGKAAALQSGFAKADRLGFTHAVTIDTDGQHDPADLHALLRLLESESSSLIIGARKGERSAVPLLSRLGRAISNRLVWLECGLRVSDSQSGMRIYPLFHKHLLTGGAGRYGFETEVIVRAGWLGIHVVETPIRCIYDLAGGRTTHFRLARDTLASAGMHIKLLLRALLPYPTRVPRTDTGSTGSIPRRLARWFSPRRLISMATGDARSRERLAASVGIGLLMAMLPIYGMKTALCLWLSGRFRLHPLAVISISSLSTPPLGFAFVAASILTGSLLLHGRLPDLSAIDPRSTAQWTSVNTLLTEWIVGSVAAGGALGLVGYMLTRACLLAPPRPNPQVESPS